MEDGVATVCFATGMAAIGAAMLALLREGDHVVVEPVPVRQHRQPVRHAGSARGARSRSSTRRTPRTSSARSSRRRGSSSSRRSPTRARRSPTSRASAQLCAAARHPLRRRQHDDLAGAVPAEDRRRGARRQRADQVHRRPRQCARRQHHRHGPLRLDALSATSPTTTRRAAARCGASSRSARRACATGAARSPPTTRITSPSAPRRWRCGWSASARTRRRSRVSRRASESARGPLSGTRRSHPQHALAQVAVRRLRRTVLVRARRRHRLLRFAQSARIVVSSSNLGDNRTLAIPVAHTIFWEMGAERRAGDGHRRLADPRFGRDRGPRRPDRRFRAGAGVSAR